MREVELDLQVSPEEIMSSEVELGCESWTSFASSCSSTAVQRTTAVETAIARCTSGWAMARGHRLNSFIVLAAVHGLSGLFRPLPHPPSPPSLISHLACVDVKQNGFGRKQRNNVIYYMAKRNPIKVIMIMIEGVLGAPSRPSSRRLQKVH